MKDNHDKALREHLLELLKGGGAHAKFEDAIADLPDDLRGKKVQGLPYTFWMVLEHMRIAQWDILDFSINQKYKAMKWPDGYWPKTEAPTTDAAWNDSIKKFKKDLKAVQDLVANPKTDLYAKILWGEGQTVLREALLVADHNAYHLGALAVMNRILKK